jgi:hypothetical protein
MIFLRTSLLTLSIVCTLAGSTATFCDEQIYISQQDLIHEAEKQFTIASFNPTSENIQILFTSLNTAYASLSWYQKLPFFKPKSFIFNDMLRKLVGIVFLQLIHNSLDVRLLYSLADKYGHENVRTVLQESCKRISGGLGWESGYLHHKNASAA